MEVAPRAIPLWGPAVWTPLATAPAGKFDVEPLQRFWPLVYLYDYRACIQYIFIYTHYSPNNYVTFYSKTENLKDWVQKTNQVKPFQRNGWRPGTSASRKLSFAGNTAAEWAGEYGFLATYWLRPAVGKVILRGQRSVKQTWFGLSGDLLLFGLPKGPFRDEFSRRNLSSKHIETCDSSFQDISDS